MSTGGRTNILTPQTGAPIDLFFIMPTGDPAFLTAATAINDKTIAVTDASDFAVNKHAGLFCPVENRFYFSDVASVVDNEITFDTPLDFAFMAGDFALPLTRNMNVDGSSESKIFQIQGGGGASTLKVCITGITIQMECKDAVDMNKFGDGDPLENGIVLRRTNGVHRNVFNVKRNGELFSFDPHAQIFSATHPVQGINGLAAKYIFNGDAEHGSANLLLPGDSLDLIVQDDLSDFIDFTIMAKGYEVN